MTLEELVKLRAPGLFSELANRNNPSFYEDNAIYLWKKEDDCWPELKVKLLGYEDYLPLKNGTITRFGIFKYLEGRIPTVDPNPNYILELEECYRTLTKLTSSGNKFSPYGNWRIWKNNDYFIKEKTLEFYDTCRRHPTKRFYIHSTDDRWAKVQENYCSFQLSITDRIIPESLHLSFEVQVQLAQDYIMKGIDPLDQIHRINHLS